MGLWCFEKVNEVGGHEMECYSDVMCVITSEHSFVVVVVVVVVVVCEVMHLLVLIT